MEIGIILYFQIYKIMFKLFVRKPLADAFSLLTTTEDVATGLIVSGGKVPFPYFGAAMRPEHNHTHGQPLPPKASSYHPPYSLRQR